MTAAVLFAGRQFTGGPQHPFFGDGAAGATFAQRRRQLNVRDACVLHLSLQLRREGLRPGEFGLAFGEQPLKIGDLPPRICRFALALREAHAGLLEISPGLVQSAFDGVHFLLAALQLLFQLLLRLMALAQFAFELVLLPLAAGKLLLQRFLLAFAFVQTAFKFTFFPLAAFKFLLQAFLYAFAFAQPVFDLVQFVVRMPESPPEKRQPEQQRKQQDEGDGEQPPLPAFEPPPLVAEFFFERPDPRLGGFQSISCLAQFLFQVIDAPLEIMTLVSADGEPGFGLTKVPLEIDQPVFEMQPLAQATGQVVFHTGEMRLGRFAHVVEGVTRAGQSGRQFGIRLDRREDPFACVGKGAEFGKHLRVCVDADYEQTKPVAVRLAHGAHPILCAERIAVLAVAQQDDERPRIGPSLKNSFRFLESHAQDTLSAGRDEHDEPSQLTFVSRGEGFERPYDSRVFVDRNECRGEFVGNRVGEVVQGPLGDRQPLLSFGIAPIVHAGREVGDQNGISDVGVTVNAFAGADRRFVDVAVMRRVPVRCVVPVLLMKCRTIMMRGTINMLVTVMVFVFAVTALLGLTVPAGLLLFAVRVARRFGTRFAGAGRRQRLLVPAGEGNQQAKPDNREELRRTTPEKTVA